MEETPKSEGLVPPKTASKLKDVVIRARDRAPAKVQGKIPPERALTHAGPIQNLANYKRLVARAVDVFGDEIKASKWLSLPNSELNGDTPLEVARRHHYDGEVLEHIFTQIEHGIYF